MLVLFLCIYLFCCGLSSLFFNHFWLLISPSLQMFLCVRSPVGLRDGKILQQHKFSAQSRNDRIWIKQAVPTLPSAAPQPCCTQRTQLPGALSTARYQRLGVLCCRRPAGSLAPRATSVGPCQGLVPGHPFHSSPPPSFTQ